METKSLNAKASRSDETIFLSSFINALPCTCPRSLVREVEFDAIPTAPPILIEHWTTFNSRKPNKCRIS